MKTVAAALLLLLPAGQERDWKAEVDRLVQPEIRSGKRVGVAVGILVGGRSAVFGYGKDRVPDGDTVFEIGSITKVFTTALLADMAARGEAALDAPVRKLLPADVKVPRHGEQEITLEQLATHTSGLPRQPADLLAAADPDNPYVSYGTKDLYASLAKIALSRPPGEKSEYSNLGMGLLGHALARRLGGTYEKAVLDRICRPLGMKDTTIALSPDRRKRLAAGHSAERKPVPGWDFDALAGAGALRSTVNDMLRFAAANLGADGPLKAVFETCHRPRAKEGDLDVGLAWVTLPPDPAGRRVIWHNGRTGGYSSFLGLVKDRGVAVVVLSNSSADVDELALKVLALLP